MYLLFPEHEHMQVACLIVVATKTGFTVCGIYNNILNHVEKQSKMTKVAKKIP